MSFNFDSDTKERVRDATDIVDLIGNRLELRRQGRNYVALCPWHRDSRPSLQINVDKQIWKCWVCDIGGDVFNFLMQDEGIAFPEALKKLADRAGISLSAPQSRGQTKSNGGDTKVLAYRALEWAQEVFQEFLLQAGVGDKARQYLESRGFTPATLQRFGIGLAPSGWSTLLDRAGQKNLNPYALESAGLVIKKDRGGYYDRFRDRIMFPIRDREQRIVAFGGRVLPNSEESAKYINSPETLLFKKSQHLYGFDLASREIRQAKQAIVMEGYTDVMFAHQCGLNNAVAVLGTALGPPHLKLLQRHGCNSVVLLLDGDEAGQRRSDDVLELFLHAQVDVRVLSLPDNMDPADFLQRQGVDAMRQLIASAADAFDFKIKRVSSGFDPLVDTHRANTAIEEMLALLAKVPHSGLLSNESFRLRQNQVLPRLARQFSIAEESLRERLSNLRRKQSQFQRRDNSDESPQPQRLTRPTDLSPFERELLELIIVAPQIAPIALERVQSGWLESGAAQQMLDAYQEMEFSGQSLEFESVLSALEDPSLKSLLVTLHEQANTKLKYTRDTAENRLRVLTQRMGERQDVQRRQLQMTELEKREFSAEEELVVLHDVIRQARLRQGLVTIEELGEVDADDPTSAVPGGRSDVDVPMNEQSTPR